MAEKVTKQDVEALVDGGLKAEEILRVSMEMEHDPSLKAYYDELQDQKELLKQWWRYSDAQ